MSSNTITKAEDTTSAPSTTTAPQDLSAGCGGMEAPGPAPQHEWLQQFVGEWESEVEIFMEPGKPPMKTKGAEHARMVGGFWLVSEGRNVEFPYSFMLTLGYDPQRGKYVGTWADTMMPYLWRYEGTVDATGKILTLETEGPAPGSPDRHTKFREVTEFKSREQRQFTSRMLGEDGQWHTILTVNARRKK